MDLLSIPVKSDFMNLFIVNSPVSHLARHQRPARERDKIRSASQENVDNQTPHNTNFTH